MRVEAECQQCHVEDEILGHALFDCERSWDFWLETSSVDFYLEIQAFRFDAIMQVAYDKLTKVDFELFMVCL